jgi:hypothetical protein
MIGDFNFREMGEPAEDTQLIEFGYQDVWVYLHKESYAFLLLTMYR